MRREGPRIVLRGRGLFERGGSPAVRRGGVGPCVLFERLPRSEERVLGGGALLREGGSGGDLGFHLGAAVAGLLYERADGSERLARVELVAASGTVRRLFGEPVVLPAQVLVFHGGAGFAG
jgi:hypothetical protein